MKIKKQTNFFEALWIICLGPGLKRSIFLSLSLNELFTYSVYRRISKTQYCCKKEVLTVWVSHQTHLRIVTISTSVPCHLPPSTHLSPGLQGQDWLCGVVKFVTHTLLSIWIRFWMRVPSSAWLSRGIDVFGGIFAHSLGLLVGASGPSEYMGTVRICSLHVFNRYIH